MMTTLLSFSINVIVVLLLVTMIFYCRRLSTSIKTLQNSKNDMAKLFGQFDESIGHARQSVEELQEAAEQTRSLLQEKLKEANLVADDLTFMIERGIKMADQMEGGMKRGVSSPPPKSESGAGPTANSPASRNAASTSRPQVRKDPAPKTENPKGSKASSIESVLDQIANRNKPKGKDGESANSAGSGSGRVRSRAEQELFDSLKSGR